MTHSLNPDLLARSLWPEVVFSSDIATVLKTSPYDAHRALEAGRFGPHFMVDGRPAVLRGDLIQALRRLSRGESSREVLP